MARKSGSLLHMCKLLLLISFLPHEMTSSVVTVNGKTENYIMDTQPGVQASLECAVQNHTRDEELLWYRENGRVDLKSGNKINTSSVCVSSITEKDNGVNFTCKLQSNQMVSVSVVLNVIYEESKALPAVKVSVGDIYGACLRSIACVGQQEHRLARYILMVPPLLSGNSFQTVEENSDAKLVCSVKSNPQAQMIWYKDDSVLTLKKDHHQIYQASESFQLSISKVKKSDNGTYTCVANSSLKMETLDFHLIVKDKTVTLPIEPIIAACVVVFLTLCFGLVARRKRILKLCMKEKSPHTDTAL